VTRPLLVALGSLFFAGGATAATFTFTPSTTPVTVATVTLSGVDQTKTFTIPNTVAYTGGNNNAGWKVQASATTPTAGSNTLPALIVTAGSATCQTSCTTNPTNSIAYPLTMSGTAQTIFNAATSTGQGTFTVTSTFQVSYASNIFPGTYTSTVTLTGSTGP
jgi:hypothetical protein